MYKLSMALGALMLTVSACSANAAAATNLCPFPAGHITVQEAGGDPDAPISMPPNTGGDYSTDTVQRWDLSNAKTKSFEVVCAPNAQGNAGAVPQPLPLGTNSVKFDTKTHTVTVN